MRLLASPHAQRIALPRRLHLDDFRTEIAEQLAAEGAREQRAELDHAQIGKRAVLESGVGHQRAACESPGASGEFRLRGRLEARLRLAARLELVERLEAAIEELFRAALTGNFLAQRFRRALIDRQIVFQHHPVTQRTFATHEAGIHVELHFRRIPLERIAAAAATPCIEIKQIARLDLDVIRLRGEQLFAACSTHEHLAPAFARKSAIGAPGISEPAVVVNGDLTGLEKPVADAQCIAAAVLAGAATVREWFRTSRCAAGNNSRETRSARW